MVNNIHSTPMSQLKEKKIQKNFNDIYLVTLETRHIN